MPESERAGQERKMIVTTDRCPEPTCREACEQVSAGTGDGTVWLHTAQRTLACGKPEAIDVEPGKLTLSGRLWRLMEWREAMRRDAAATASKIVAEQVGIHCGDCAAGLRMSIAGAIEAAAEAAHSWSQDEYLRPHPADRAAVSV